MGTARSLLRSTWTSEGVRLLFWSLRTFPFTRQGFFARGFTRLSSSEAALRAAPQLLASSAGAPGASFLLCSTKPDLFRLKDQETPDSVTQGQQTASAPLAPTEFFSS